MPLLLRELQGLNLNPTFEDRYGKAIIIIAKKEYTQKAQKAVALIAKQMNLKIIDFPEHIGVF